MFNLSKEYQVTTKKIRNVKSVNFFMRTDVLRRLKKYTKRFNGLQLFPLLDGYDDFDLVIQFIPMGVYSFGKLHLATFKSYFLLVFLRYHLNN